MSFVLFVSNKCTACRVLAEDMENYQKQFKQLTKLKTFFQDQYCSLLGYNFSPYLWLEELCEEMIEDHLSKFLFVKSSCFHSFSVYQRLSSIF
jgi:hypothetical protein